MKQHSSSTCLWNISLSWSDIPELVVPTMISLIEGCCKHGNYWTKGSLWLNWSHHFESCTVATMTCLNVTEYLCHKWPCICSVLCNHNPVVSSFMTYHRVCSKSKTTDQERYRYTFPEHTSSSRGFSGFRNARSLVFCVMFCKSLFVLLSFFYWPLCCLFFDIWLLITP